MALSQETIDHYQAEGYTPQELEALERTAGEAMETQKRVLMEKERGKFQRMRTVFDIPTQTGRLLQRLFYER